MSNICAVRQYHLKFHISLRTVDPNLPQQTETLSKYKTGRPRRRKKGTRPLKDNICYGEGRSVGQSDSRGTEGRKEGRRERGREREKRLIEKDSEMLTADRQKRQGAEIFDSTNMPLKDVLVTWHISPFHISFSLIHPGLA